MVKTVKEAFKIFMRDKVDLDPDTVNAARDSRDNLLQNIAEFDDSDFFTLRKDINIQFGSFARKTKIRPLDDIDLMIGMHADGAMYDPRDPWDNVRIYASRTNSMQQDCLNDDGSNTLNSTKVLNRFKLKLDNVRDYSRSELHRNGEAVTLNLKSKQWNFDIVPCFQTVADSSDSCNYYLIPNGKGCWKKTDPRIDRDYVKKVNYEKGGKVLPLVRLCKKWFEVKKFETPASYLIETLVVKYCKNAGSLDDSIGFNFMKFLLFLKSEIFNNVQDMKNVQGNINNINTVDRQKISEMAERDSQKYISALVAEIMMGQEKAINIWRAILGEDFPTYG